MASTRAALEEISKNLDESIGVRSNEYQPQLSPVAAPQDIGRRPLRNFGRVDIDRVQRDPEQPRTEFSEEAIQRLAQSIRTKGQLHPIRVRWSEELEKWLIISGERRWRATQAAGLPSIDCYFQNDNLETSDILEQQLIENLLREDLKPMEEAKAYASLMKQNSWNGKKVASALHVSPSKVSRALTLLTLPEEVQQQIDSGELNARSAYELSKLPKSSQVELASQPGRLTAKKARAAVRQRRGKPSSQKRGFKQTFLGENGVKVLVSTSKKVNYHEIEQALTEATEEIRHYIKQGLQVF